MKARLQIPLVAKLLLVLLFIGLLGFTPLSRQASQSLNFARQALEANAYLPASVSLSRAASYLPWRSDLVLAAGRAAFYGGDFQTAILVLDRIDQSGELEPVDRLMLADALHAEGQSPHARAIWQELALEGEFLPEVNQRLLDIDMQAKDYPAIITDLESLVKLHPQDAALVYRLGLYLAATDPEAAIMYLDRAAGMDPAFQSASSRLAREISTARLSEEPAYILTRSGQVLAGLGEWELAAEAFRQASRIRPDYAEAWAYLGEALQHLEPEDQTDWVSIGYQAISYALALDEKSLSANLFMALYWQRAADYEKSLERLETAANLYPENPVLQVELGRATALSGDLQAAIPYFQEAIQLEPRDPAYWKAMAEFSVLNQVNIRDLALPAAQQALALSPNDPEAEDLLGQAYALVEERTAAIHYFTRAMRADPTYLPASLHLAVLYLDIGNHAQARELLEEIKFRSLENDPEMASQAQRLLDYYFH